MDKILLILKDNKLNNRKRQNEIQELLNTKISDERFAFLIDLGKKVNDWSSDDILDNSIDESIGINVQFEGPNDEDDDDDNEIELTDDDTSDHEENNTIDSNIGRINLNKDSNEILQPRTIDEFWLERHLNKIYPENTDIKIKTEEILNILKSSTDKHELENKLIISLGSEQFEFIKILRTNRQMSKYPFDFFFLSH